MVLQAQWYGTKLKPCRMKSRSAIPGSIQVLSQLTEICLSEGLKLRFMALVLSFILALNWAFVKAC